MLSSLVWKVHVPRSTSATPSAAGSGSHAWPTKVGVPEIVVPSVIELVPVAGVTGYLVPDWGPDLIVPASRAVFVAVLIRAAFSCGAVQSGYSWARIAAAPATWGVAIEVPDSRV